jgi:lipopolysaccharide transport system ATP-binding protein
MRRFFARPNGTNPLGGTNDSIWALRDVSFEVRPGEVVGVIGRNGAGKSTLLKVLSRITEPTKGAAWIRGRIGSLLEVGSGFHPELTGRENVYLNGAILGMRRAEMDRKLDQIVEFAEVRKFIDTPVKFYSSGMYLRLAFSVAAHLETEILLVDEVLAVGDLRFQKRCLGKMESVAAKGRTVLFVSHNLATLKKLCQTALVLEEGALAFRGRISEGLAHYSQLLGSHRDLPPKGTVWRDVTVGGEAGDSKDEVLSDQPFEVEATLDVKEDFSKARLYCLVEDSSGDGVLHNYIDRAIGGSEGLPAGRYQVRVEVPPLWLFPDVYVLHFKLIARRSSGLDEKHLSERVILNVADQSTQSVGRIRATLIPPLKWTISAVDQVASSMGERE